MAMSWRCILPKHLLWNQQAQSLPLLPLFYYIQKTKFCSIWKMFNCKNTLPEIHYFLKKSIQFLRTKYVRLTQLTKRNSSKFGNFKIFNYCNKFYKNFYQLKVIPNIWQCYLDFLPSVHKFFWKNKDCLHKS